MERARRETRSLLLVCRQDNKKLTLFLLIQDSTDIYLVFVAGGDACVPGHFINIAIAFSGYKWQIKDSLQVLFPTWSLKCLQFLLAWKNWCKWWKNWTEKHFFSKKCKVDIAKLK